MVDILKHYTEAINRINDHLEYDYRSKEDKDKIIEILSKLTEDIKGELDD